MTNRDMLDYMHNRRVEQRQEGKKQYLDKSRDRLMTILTTKIKTTMIGSLHQFELVFGYVWGHGKPLDQLTEDEQANRALWDEVRTNILNNGNNQIRGMRQELENNTVHWDRYRTDFKVE